MKMENRDSMLTEFQKETNNFRIEEAKKYKTKPTTLDEWKDMTRDIYGPAHFDMSLSSICLHFIEEIGEVSKCIQIAQSTDAIDSKLMNYVISKLENELADVFSWIFGLYNKIEQYTEKLEKYYIQTGVSSECFPKYTIADLAIKELQENNSG